MIKPIAIIVGATVIWVASCLLLKKDKRKRVAFRKTNEKEKQESNDSC
ncbi:hypothetical protein bcere0013_23760 [Bacillus cereus BDRD-ST26]|nr:hypothetical protein bcere0013_23760 [Bacillus cereus BDRD-ST26]